MRQAHGRDGGVTINAVAPFGNIEVLLPDGVEVDVGGFSLFGSEKIAVGERGPTASPPLVRVRAFTLFGSLKVRRP